LEITFVAADGFIKVADSCGTCGGNYCCKC